MCIQWILDSFNNKTPNGLRYFANNTKTLHLMTCSWKQLPQISCPHLFLFSFMCSSARPPLHPAGCWWTSRCRDMWYFSFPRPGGTTLPVHVRRSACPLQLPVARSWRRVRRWRFRPAAWGCPVPELLSMACRLSGSGSYNVVVIPLRTSLCSLDALRFYLWVRCLCVFHKQVGF